MECSKLQTVASNHVNAVTTVLDENLNQREVTLVTPRSIPNQRHDVQALSLVELRSAVTRPLPSQSAIGEDNDQKEKKLLQGDNTVQVSRKSNESTVSLTSVVLGKLINFGIFDVARYGRSPQERHLYMINNIEEVKEHFIESLKKNLSNPMLQYVMTETKFNLSDLYKLIVEMPIESISKFNLSDIRIVDQLPFYIRSIYSSLEDKAQFVQDMDWMNPRSLETQQIFKRELALVELGNEKRLLALHNEPAPYVDTLCIGRGNNMTKYWEFMPPEGKDNSTMFIGQNSGIWHETYQLAQRSGVLEYSPDTAASTYNSNILESFNDSQVNAKHLYQSLIHSQLIHQFPGIVGEVTKVTRHPENGYQVQITYNLAGKRYFKTIHVNKLIVGTGLSDSKNIFYQKGQFYKEDFKGIVGDNAPHLFRSLVNLGYFQPSGKSLYKTPQLHELQHAFRGQYTNDQIASITQIINTVNDGRMLSSLLSKIDYERLATFNPNKGFTPIVDGNTFILSNAESTEQGMGRKILVWGGGGTAAAATRRGLFNEDAPHIKVTPETFKERVNDVTWIARNGFDTLRDGTLAFDATSTLDREGRLWGSCELTGIEPIEGDRLRVFIDRYQVVNDFKKYPTNSIVMRNIEGRPRPCIKTQEILEVDQLIHNLGQDSRNIEQIFEDVDINSNAEIAIASELGVPLYGTVKGDPNIQFHGAAFSTYPFANKSIPILEKTIVSENVPPDVGPGSMPLSWGSLRATHFTNFGVYYKSVNVTMDFAALIDRHLQRWGIVDAKLRDNFLKDIVANRVETRGGITTHTLNQIIRKHGLQARLMVDSTCMLCPILSAL